MLDLTLDSYLDPNVVSKSLIFIGVMTTTPRCFVALKTKINHLSCGSNKFNFYITSFIIVKSVSQ